MTITYKLCRLLCKSHSSLFLIVTQSTMDTQTTTMDPSEGLDSSKAQDSEFSSKD